MASNEGTVKRAVPNQLTPLLRVGRPFLADHRLRVPKGSARNGRPTFSHSKCPAIAFHRLCHAVCCFFLLTSAIFTGAATPTNLVTVTPRLSVDKARPGDSFQVAVVLEIAKGWHIQAANPTFDYLVPTELNLTPENGIETNAVSYPAPTKSKLGDDAIDVLEGRPVLRFTVTLLPNFPLGSHFLRGKLSFQPCDDQVCLAPQKLDVAIPFEVVGAGT